MCFHSRVAQPSLPFSRTRSREGLLSLNWCDRLQPLVLLAKHSSKSLWFASVAPPLQGPITATLPQRGLGVLSSSPPGLEFVGGPCHLSAPQPPYQSWPGQSLVWHWNVPRCQYWGGGAFTGGYWRAWQGYASGCHVPVLGPNWRFFGTQGRSKPSLRW